MSCVWDLGFWLCDGEGANVINEQVSHTTRLDSHLLVMQVKCVTM